MNKKLGISVAHSYRAKGASYHGINEYELSRLWSGYIARHLDPRIELALLTGTNLKEKVAMVNILKCDLAIEVHFNACGGCGAAGCETLYCPGSQAGEAAATIVQRHLVTALTLKDRGIKEGWYKMDRPDVIDYKGDKNGDEVIDFFLRETKMPALIVEPEFIEQVHHLTEKQYSIGAKAIADAIQEILL